MADIVEVGQKKVLEYLGGEKTMLLLGTGTGMLLGPAVGTFVKNMFAIDDPNMQYITRMVSKGAVAFLAFGIGAGEEGEEKVMVTEGIGLGALGSMVFDVIGLIDQNMGTNLGESVGIQQLKSVKKLLKKSVSNITSAERPSVVTRAPQLGGSAPAPVRASSHTPTQQQIRVAPEPQVRAAPVPKAIRTESRVEQPPVSAVEAKKTVEARKGAQPEAKKIEINESAAGEETLQFSRVESVGDVGATTVGLQRPEEKKVRRPRYAIF